LGPNSRSVAAESLRAGLSRFDWSGQTASRQAALEAFLRLANEEGFTGATMRKLAGALHIKAPTLYAHFPDGRDEIIAESLRWHFSKFGVAILAAVEQTDTAREFWDAMVRVHMVRQVTLPESDLWDLLLATDAIVHFLPPGLHDEAMGLVALYENMYRAAADDMGIADVSDLDIRLALSMIEGANRWCSATDLEHAIERATEVSHSLVRSSVRSGPHV
jgi:AcrR family transcriptional regulator